MAAAALLAACQPEAETTAREVRPVRTVTVAKREIGEIVALTGRIEAENETRLAFRIGGRMIERSVNVGDQVEPDQVVAKLDPQDQLNGLRAACRTGAICRGQERVRAPATSVVERRCLARRVRAAEQALETARAQLDTAEAQLRTAEDQVSRTEMRVDAAGVVTATAVEPGEIVQAGQTVIRVARQDGRDAVFDVPGRILRSASRDPLITVSLTDDPQVTCRSDSRRARRENTRSRSSPW